MARFASRLALRGRLRRRLPPMSADVTPRATDWPSTNYDETANRYSPLDQITAAKRRHAAAGLELSSQARRLYRPPARRRSHSDRDRQHDVSRVAVWRDPRARRDHRRGEVEVSASEQRPAVEARHRLLAGRRCAFRRRSSSARLSGGLYSIKASDGTLNAGLRRERRRQSQDARGDADRHERGRTRCCLPPTIYKNLIIIGAGTGEGAGGSNAGAGPAGDTRAFDAQDRQAGVDLPHRAAAGRVRLRHLGREQRQELAPASMSGATCRSMSERGILYMPLGAPNNDRVGIDRPGNNLFSSSVVAVDANTGKYLWHFQLVHHDIWDYDTQSAPLLVDLQPGRDNGSRRHHRQQDRIDVHAQSRHRQADLRHRGASGAEERRARRADVADAAVPGQAASR